MTVRKKMKTKAKLCVYAVYDKQTNYEGWCRI